MDIWRLRTLYQVSDSKGQRYNSLSGYRGMESPGQSLNALLLKFCRVSTNPQGVKMYNAKLSSM